VVLPGKSVHPDAVGECSEDTVHDH